MKVWKGLKTGQRFVIEKAKAEMDALIAKPLGKNA